MKILQINKFCFPRGGAERHLFDVSEFLMQKGHKVVIWGTKHPWNASWLKQEDFTRFNDLSRREGFFRDLIKLKDIFWNSGAAKQLEKVVIKERPDVAHCHNIFSHLSASVIFMLKKHNIPIVMTLHDYKMFCPNYSFFYQNRACYDCLKKKHFRSCLYKKCAKKSFIENFAAYLESVWNMKILRLDRQIDFFIAPSAFMREKAVEWGIPGDKIVRIPNPACPAEPWRSGIDKLDRTGYDTASPKDKYLLAFGRLSRGKGFDLLVRAFMKIADYLPGWKLKIVGDGPEMKKLREMTQGEEKIEFLGRKEMDGGLKEIIAGAYAVIVPSVCPENFPYVVLESFALGKPVLATDIGGLPEIVEDNKTGCLFKAGDIGSLARKIIWMTDHPEQTGQMGKNARKAVAVYGPESYYNEIVRIYERVKNN